MELQTETLPANWNRFFFWILLTFFSICALSGIATWGKSPTTNNSVSDKCSLFFRSKSGISISCPAVASECPPYSSVSWGMTAGIEGGLFALCFDEVSSRWTNRSLDRVVSSSNLQKFHAVHSQPLSFWIILGISWDNNDLMKKYEEYWRIFNNDYQHSPTLSVHSPFRSGSAKVRRLPCTSSARSPMLQPQPGCYAVEMLCLWLWEFNITWRSDGQCFSGNVPSRFATRSALENKKGPGGNSCPFCNLSTV